MKIIDLGTPQKVGYYQIKLFQNCQFSIFANSLIATSKLQNPGPTIHSTLGILFHELIEGLNEIDDEAQKLEAATKMISEKSDVLRTKPEYWWLEPLFSYSKTSVLLNKVVNLRKHKENNSESRTIETHFEYEVLSPDKIFGGRIDKISV